MRKRTPVQTDASDLPGEIARGPDPKVWAPGSGNPRDAAAAWRRAGESWATARGLGGNGWFKYLPDHVFYCVHALGRHHVSRGGLIPPWADGYNPADYGTVAGRSVHERGEALLFRRDDGEDRPLDD